MKSCSYPDWDRTDDLLHVTEALSQLSYRIILCPGGWTRTSKRMNQSAYEADAITTSAHTGIFEHPPGDDPGSHPYRGRVLPVELQVHTSEEHCKEDFTEELNP